ncbi:MAG: alpha-2-macroglobulin, partial [Gemmataceae bacterium]|nr:alpha-2-macroglobulin [Gemmataceae bacterium]
VANIHTLTDDQEPGVNQGMGRFEFTPELGRSYQLRIDSPIKMHGKGGKQYSYLLPKVKPDGVVLRIPQGVADDTINVQVTSAGKNRDLLIGAYCRGKLLDHVFVEAKADKPAGVTLRPTHGIGGVFRVTVFEKLPGGAVQPLAERLLYRRAPQKLLLTARTDKQTYYPGDRVQLTLAAENENKEFAPAIALVAVADLSVHKLANDKTARAMPTHFLLTSEVRQPEDLEYADFFLGAHPKAAQALDLLLGVQGWRRFAEQDPSRFQNNRDAARFLLAMAPGGRQTNNPEKVALDDVDARFAPEFILLQKKLAERESTENGAADTIRDLQTQQNMMGTHQGNIQTTYSRLDDYERMLGRIGLGLLVVFTLLGGLLCLYGGMKRMARGRSGVGFFVVGGCILLFLIMGSLAGTFYLMGGRSNMRDDMFMDGRGPVAMKMAMAPAPPPPMMVAPGGPGGMPNQGIAEGPMVADMAKAAPMEMEMQRFGAELRPNAAAQPMAAMGEGGAGMGMPAGGGFRGGPPMGAFGGGGMPGGMAMPGMAGIEPGDFAGGQFMMPGGPGAPMAFNPERLLRMQSNFKELIQQRLRRAVSLPSASDPFLVREYAHTRGQRQEEVRTDFTETLLWQPALVMQDGKASLAFDLSDASTRFQVVVFGHTLDGRIGATTFEFASRLPVSIEPKMPIEVTSSDKIQIPLAIANDSNKGLPVSVQVFPKNLRWITDEKLMPLPGRGVELSLDPKARVREVFEFQPTIVEGLANLRFSCDFAELGKDIVERSFKIVPEGFPVTGSASGLLEKSATHFFELPEKIVPDTLKCQVNVFPSTLAELQKGLDSLLREPCGCFEQSSTSNYPNVLILNYLREADLANPELEKRSRQLLNSGYAKLTSFECLDPKETTLRRGYEWFGQTAPPHEALTAYGLLQFRDMARVHPVDEEMLKRTQAYLLGQRDGKGGFKRNPRALDSFGRAPDHVTNAYIVWALTESKIEEDLGAELKALEEKAKATKDPYFLALVAAGHLNAGKSDVGVDILKQLREMQKEDGEVTGAATSITGSGGRDLVIETTALATLGWLKANRPDEFHNHIDRAVKWIGKQRGGYGGFGATQSTILALKALIAHTKESKRPVEPGNLVLYVNDRPNPVAVLNFTATAQESITLAVPKGDYLVAGKNRVRVEISGKNEFPYTLSWSYQTLKPVNPPQAPVHMSATLNKTEAKEGDTVRLSATVENKSGKGQGMAVAIIGLPGGLALPEDMAQLKEMAAPRENGTKPGVISSWELRGRELVLYWRDLAPDAKIELSFDLVCRIPGVYTGPASRAYLYYNADDKYWADPLAVTIRP